MGNRDGQGLSTRASQFIDEGVQPAYLAEHVARTTGEVPLGGYVCLAIAENKVMWDLLDEKVNAPRAAELASVGYDDWRGSRRLRESLARFVGDRLHRHPVDPDSVQVMAGAGPLVEALTWALCEPGSGVLVPTPSYAGYWFDVGARTGVTIVPAHTAADEDFRITEEVLDTAWVAATVPIRMLLFTNPSNPLGRVHADEEVHTVIRWARAKRIPVVVNEIYGLSTLGDARFHSAASLGYADADDVHFLWAASKDLSASGLRCGVLVTRHEPVKSVLRQLGYFHGVSGDTQHLLVTMLEDEDWVDRYLTALHDRLLEAAECARRPLAAAHVATFRHDAGMFFLADLRPHLDEPTWAAENRLWRRLIDEAEVNLTPGSACRNGEPGLFRVCYASQAVDVVEASMTRVAATLEG